MECSEDNCFLKQHTSQDWLTIINDKKNLAHYKKGHHIITEGNSVMGLYFICKGKVKVTTLGLNGKEQIVRLASDGHILGHRGFGHETYPIGAVAMEESLVCFISNELAHEVMMHNPLFTYELMMFYSRELRKTESRIKYLSQMTIKERVGEALLYLVDTFGVTSDKKINISLSRSEIAELAGTNADQVSRSITEFKEEKVLNTDGKDLVLLNPAKLHELVGQYNIYE